MQLISQFSQEDVLIMPCNHAHKGLGSISYAAGNGTAPKKMLDANHMTAHALLAPLPVSTPSSAERCPSGRSAQSEIKSENFPK